MKELQDNVNAVNFTPQSKMGKMLMAKCRTLQEENEEIGNQAKEGKVLAMNLDGISSVYTFCPRWIKLIVPRVLR